MRKGIAIGAGTVALLLIGTVAFLWAGDTDPDAMRARYAAETDRYAEMAGMRVRYRVSGPEGAPVLVLMHGTSASLHAWEPLRERLDDRYRVIAYDHPGHGLTGPHPKRAYDYDGFADGLDAVFAAERIQGAVLVGHSLGGWIAWRDALEHPERVRALVLISASGVPIETQAKSSLAFRLMRTPPGRLAALKLTPRAAIESTTYDAAGRDEIVTEEMVDRYWELLRYPGNRRALADQFATTREDHSDRIGEVVQPTLLLWGDEDRMQPLSVGRGFAERMPGARLVVYEGVGHLPAEEAPDAVAAEITAFLDDLPR